MEKFRFLDLRLFYWECYFVYVDGGCVSKLIFKPEMFLENHGALTPKGMADIAQKQFDKWLEKQTVVFGFGASDGWGWRTDSRNGETKKAYVVCIQDIKCEHINIKFEFDFFKCKDCNKQLKPKNGWEICENGS